MIHFPIIPKLQIGKLYQINRNLYIWDSYTDSRIYIDDIEENDLLVLLDFYAHYWYKILTIKGTVGWLCAPSVAFKEIKK